MRLFGTALQRIGDDPELQQLLREHRELIPNFVEECLRIESPVKGDFRLARVTTERRRRRDPRGHHGDGRQRRRQPRSRASFECPSRLRGRARQRAPAPRVRPRPAHVPGRPARRAPRVASPSSACSTGWTTSGSPKPSTARPAPAATTTCRRTSCVGSAACTSSGRPTPRALTLGGSYDMIMSIVRHPIRAKYADEWPVARGGVHRSHARRTRQHLLRLVSQRRRPQRVSAGRDVQGPGRG